MRFFSPSVLLLLLALSLPIVSGCSSRPDQSSATGAGATVPADFTQSTTAALGEPWTAAELLAPAALAAQLTGDGPAPLVFDMGPAGTIKGARTIGPAQDKDNIARLRAALADVPKDQPVVVYCGCCPFAPCPNIRPAFQLLKSEGFTQARLLNLPHNLKADWIDAGYPMARAGE